MTALTIIGIVFEIIGFFLVIRSTKKLDLQGGGFTADRYVDPKTKQPPQHIESYPNPALYRPGIILVMFGLGLQIVDIVATQYLKYPL
jgi:hypothetical protein